MSLIGVLLMLTLKILSAGRCLQNNYFSPKIATNLYLYRFLVLLNNDSSSYILLVMFLLLRSCSYKKNIQKIRLPTGTVIHVSNNYH